LLGASGPILGLEWGEEHNSWYCKKCQGGGEEKGPFLYLKLDENQGGGNSKIKGMGGGGHIIGRHEKFPAHITDKRGNIQEPEKTRAQRLSSRRKKKKR